MVLRVSSFNILFSRINLILKSFRFVAVRIHAEKSARFAGCPCLNENRKYYTNCS